MQAKNIKRYNKYHIKETDRFNVNDFPKLQLELDDILVATKGIPQVHKEDIFIAYLKKQTLEKEWVDSNNGFTDLLKGGSLVTSHLEALFDSGQANRSFLHGLEDHIRETLAQNAA
ncbi:MAG TPA: hypothetical protein VMZ03_00325 [Chitinophagaceae bacterium]|nr:hypothetical protein [Chitinophagaceae bacterium]